MVQLRPAIDGLPTGGNVYNRQLADALAALGESVHVVAWPGGAPVPADAVVLVDSLHLQHPDELRALRAEQAAARFVLLVHYLACCDPERRATPAAAQERTLLPLFDGFVVPSRFVRQGLVDAGVAAERLAVVPPGLPAPFRNPVPERPKPTVPVILTVASLLPDKGLDVLLGILEGLASRAWTWTLIGSPDLDPVYSAAFARRIAASSVSARITLVGALSPEAVRAAYDAADLFALASRFETCSLVTREAMARALPVVAFDVGGLGQNVCTPEAGMLVPPGDAAAFEEALAQLLDDAGRRTATGQRARRCAEAFPTWLEAAERVVAFLAAR